MTQPSLNDAVSAQRPEGRSHGSDIHLHSGPQLAEYAAAADRIAAAGHRHVLDWGCGYGQLTRMLRDRDVTVTAIDWVASADGVVERPLPAFPELSGLATNDPVRLPFDDASFDAVLSMGVLEHVQDPDGSLEELRRVLEPGGTVYCYKLPNPRSYLEAIAKRRGMYYHGQLEHDRLYDLQSATAIFERHGFSVLDARYANMLPLTLPGRLAASWAPLIWSANRLVSGVPGLNRLATNVELIARAPAVTG